MPVNAYRVLGSNLSKQSIRPGALRVSCAQTWRSLAKQTASRKHLVISSADPGRGIAQGAQPAVVKAEAERSFAILSDALWLRDACICPRCVDESTTQKLFQTSDLPLNINASVVKETDEAIKVAWKNDLPASGYDHTSTCYKSMLARYGKPLGTTTEPDEQERSRAIPKLWNKATMEKFVKFIQFADYQASDHAVFQVLEQLKMFGLVFIQGVPCKDTAVEIVASRIGHLRETFYGRTWDVRSVAQAKNIAYTNHFLGFHMDLLYMSDPPGLQLLHCLRNTCEGGTSMFSDGFNAAKSVEDLQKGDYEVLERYPQTFHYKNAGEHYRFVRPVAQHDSVGRLKFINWSPPFQGPFENTLDDHIPFHRYVEAAKAFSSVVKAPENIFECRLEEGDCVIFNNRRVLHARRAFDTMRGERWLKGAYVDTDVFNSRYRVLHSKWKPQRV